MMNGDMVSDSPERTLEIGREFGSSLVKGDFVALTGDLGAGKTVFTKGVACGLGVANYKYVNSPTFVFLKEYHGKMPLYHFDLYRIKSEDDLETIGYEDYFYGQGVSVVEWAEKIPGLLPDKRYSVEILYAGENKREIRISSAPAHVPGGER